MTSAPNQLPYGASPPSSWDVVPLKHLVTLSNGYAFTSDSWEETGTPIIRIENLNGSAKFNHSNLALGDKHRVVPGDLLFSWSGNPGTSFGPFRWERPGLHFLNQHIFKVAVHGCDKDWLYWSLRAATYWIERELTSGMIGMVHVTKEELANVPIPVPPLEVQRRIADFLDAETARIDEMRRCSQRQVELLGHRFKEFMRRETTVGQGPATETGVPWMPVMHHGWKLHKVSQEFRTASGTTPTSSDASYFDGPYPWVNSADVRDGSIRRVEKSVTKKALLDFSALKVHPAGALVVALYGQGATKGRVGILGVDSCLNQACCALVPVGRILAEFAYYWFRAHKDGIVAQAVGAGQPNLSQELVRQLRIPAPNVATQLQITSRLRDVEKFTRVHVSRLERRDALLAERRQALITAAVTGQFDVSTASGRNVTDGVTA
ncbi:restriction endonuclease subunit S [Streptomyces lydicus]|uniref:restriction endonuclease subunit S n=1 Tax=Streptomyces lydicus TaxID=47763 RepID=UPI003431063B